MVGGEREGICVPVTAAQANKEMKSPWVKSKYISAREARKVSRESTVIRHGPVTFPGEYLTGSLAASPDLTSPAPGFSRGQSWQPAPAGTGSAFQSVSQPRLCTGRQSNAGSREAGSDARSRRLGSTQAQPGGAGSYPGHGARGWQSCMPGTTRLGHCPPLPLAAISCLPAVTVFAL